MSYQVLARKYRPSNFEEVVGQEHVVQALSNSITQERIHQAFIFAGTRGVGKTTLARILAKCLNCQSSEMPVPVPCNKCNNCEEIKIGRSLDFFEQDAETGLRLGHATMDIRYHAGGYDAQTVVPGVAVTMMMEFQAIDAILPAGHGLQFILSEQGEDYLAPACGNACTVHVLPSSSTLELPIIQRDGSNILITPQDES